MQDLYEHLKGHWHFNRTIHDHLLNKIMTANGQAVFEPMEQPNTLLYSETGQFTDGTDFFRSYLYIFKADSIDILFADGPSKGQLFHTINLSTHPHQTELTIHLCGADTYHGFYDFTGQGSFHISYNVSGPRKGYCMETLYQKYI